MILSGTLPLWQFNNLQNQSGIRHFVSGRAGGVSSGEVGTFNLSFKVVDSAENVRENRRRLAEAMQVLPEHLLFPAQTHSTNVRLVQAHTHGDDLTNTDALITNVPDRCICVMSADCVPILLYDPVQRAVGAVHAGWRGTVGKILSRTVEAMQSNYNTRPKNLLAGIGPSICPQVYEVGAEVLAAVRETFGNVNGLIDRENAGGKGYLNLWEANRVQLLQAGVPAASIEVAGICTYQQSNDFFSARKSGNRAGRFAAGIRLTSVT